MKDDRFGGVLRGAIDRWQCLDADWQGVLLGATIVAFIVFFGVDVP
jgi:hypothetical protein